MDRGVDATVTDDEFTALATRIFAFQSERNAAIREYARRRGADPARIAHWSEIPAVPTAAFREINLIAGAEADAEKVFRTSGTTRGTERRGAHFLLDVSLYEAALLPVFRAFLLPDADRFRFLSLIPAPSPLPDSSLSHMVGAVRDACGAPHSAYAIDVERGIDFDGVRAALERAVSDGEPLCILATSFSMVHWLDHAHATGFSCRLPTGSRIMDTGGYKGKSRTVDAAELRAMYEQRLGIDAVHCVNEYGMTELSSQFYDDVLRTGVDKTPRVKAGPPWVRTLVVDPETLQPAAEGSTGLLRHYDLANLSSAVGIQTEDVGRTVPGGFVLLGRAPGATPRGCSIAMDMMLGDHASR